MPFKRSLAGQEQVTMDAHTRSLSDKNERLMAALELIANESRDDAAAWMRGVARAALKDNLLCQPK